MITTAVGSGPGSNGTAKKVNFFNKGPVSVFLTLNKKNIYYDCNLYKS